MQIKVQESHFVFNFVYQTRQLFCRTICVPGLQ